MRKLSALLLTLTAVLSLLAGCGKDAEKPSPTPTLPSGSQNENSPPPPPSYNFAAGKYQVGEDGLPHEPYDYELPLCSTGEVFSWWTTCYTPKYIPEKGFGEMEFRRTMRNNTGVNIEYVVVSPDSMEENFSVLLATDNLCDIMTNAFTYYRDSIPAALEKDFVNLYEYKDYFPNYLYWVYKHDNADVTAKVFYANDIIPAFYLIVADPLPPAGMFVRNDWLTELGQDASKMVTFDDVYDVLTLFKSQGKCEYPLLLSDTIEPLPGATFTGYNTTAYVGASLPNRRVVDSQVQFTLMQQDDRDLVGMLNKWYSDKLINPTFHSSANQSELDSMVTTDKVGYVHVNPDQIKNYKNSAVSPDMELKAVPRTLLTPDQTIKYQLKPSYFGYGSSVISSRCEDLKLLCTWCDWWYSTPGAFYCNYGTKGILWDYSESGEVQLTDFVIKNDMGPSWCMMMYALNGLTDHGLQFITRKYCYPEGKEMLASYNTWKVEGYKGEYDWPGSITLSAEQNDEIMSRSADIATYIAETYTGFVDGSIPLTQWDAYVTTLNDMGIEQCRQIYQDAYDAFMERFKPASGAGGAQDEKKPQA